MPHLQANPEPMDSLSACDDLADRKRQLRAAAADARGIASRTAGADAGARLADHGLQVLAGTPAGVVSGFMPIGEEIDVVPLIARLARAGWRTALPVVVGWGCPLTFRAWTPGEPTVAGRFAIPVPLETAAELEPDVLIVPMLAFDKAGFRLGYGGGFYDRTLASLRAAKPVVAVGAAFAGQEVDAVPREPHDEPLDWILTEQGPLRPARPARPGEPCG